MKAFLLMVYTGVFLGLSLVLLPTTSLKNILGLLLAFILFAFAFANFVVKVNNDFTTS